MASPALDAHGLRAQGLLWCGVASTAPVLPPQRLCVVVQCKGGVIPGVGVEQSKSLAPRLFAFPVVRATTAVLPDVSGRMMRLQVGWLRQGYRLNRLNPNCVGQPVNEVKDVLHPSGH